MDPNKMEGGARPPFFDAPKTQGGEAAANAVPLSARTGPQAPAAAKTVPEPAQPPVSGEKTPLTCTQQAAPTAEGCEKTAPAYGPQPAPAERAPGPQAAPSPAPAKDAPPPAYAGPRPASATEVPGPAPGAPAPARPVWAKWMAPAALLSWLWGWAYVRGWLLGFENGPLFRVLFCALFLAGVEWMCRAAGRPASKESRLWLALWVALTADYTFKTASLFYNEAVMMWEFAALHLAAAYWVLARAGVLTEQRTGPFLPLDVLRAMIAVPFGKFFLRVRVLARALGDFLQSLAHRKKGNLWAGLVTLCAAAVVVLLAARLLASADDAFGAALEAFFRWFTLPEAMVTELVYFLLGLPVGAYLFGLAAGALKTVPDPARGPALRAGAEKLRLAPAGALGLSMALLLALYAAFFAVQLNYLTGGFFGSLPAGFTAAEYARRGFFELCAVVVLNFSVLTAAAKASRIPLRQSPALKGLAALLCLSNLLFAAVGASKMFLYIRRFGFTPKRIVSGWFILVLALLTVLALITLFRPFPVVRVAAAVFCGLFLALCLSQPDLWLRAANRQLVAAGVLDEEDVGDRLLYARPQYSTWD